MKNAKSESEITIGPCVMIYGLRDTGDLIFEDELNQFKTEGVLEEIYFVYSRKKGHPKQYCQYVLVQ